MEKERTFKKGDLYIFSDSLDPNSWGFGIVKRVKKSGIVSGLTLETYRDSGRYMFYTPHKLSIPLNDSRIKKLPHPSLH